VASLRAGGGTPAQLPDLPLLFQGSPTDPVHYLPIHEDSPNLLAVTFNGCIYNHRELRKELESKGHHFTTDHSDTEVLLHGWREWGWHLFNRLDGMFAAALWDRAKAELTIVRDFAGEKPLSFGYPWTDSPSFVFASTPQALIRLERVMVPDPRPRMRTVFRSNVEQLTAKGVQESDGVSMTRVADKLVSVNLAGSELSTWTKALNNVDANVNRVDARSWIRFGWNRAAPLACVDASPRMFRSPLAALDERSEDRGWSLKLRPDGRVEPAAPLDLASAETLLKTSTIQRLDADVPVGVLLSGGIDSGLIACFAAHHQRSFGFALPAFTMRMPDPRYDESALARQLAEHVGATHHVVDCGDRAGEDLIALIERLGVPLGDSSLLPMFWVCRASREHVTVALAGDGGDELFGGYDRIRVYPWLHRLRHLAKFVPTSLLRSADQKSIVERARRFVIAARFHHSELLAIFDRPYWHMLVGQQPPPPWSPRGGNTFMEQEFNGYLEQDILRKSDTASMAVGLELRSPFLAPDLARRALATPQSVLMPRNQRKGLLRAVARKYLPKEIVDRPKMGFAIPVGEWFRSDFGQMKTLLLDSLHSADPFPADLLGLELNRRFIDQILTEHMDHKRDHSQRLYMLLVLAIWCRWLRGVQRSPVA
jgi:asparagine synthase (glutamine-hydrolysing)